MGPSRIIHVVGTRPNIPKFLPVWRALESLSAKQSWIHTGQHYSKDLFEDIAGELGLPDPDHRLEIKSSSSAEFLARCIEGLSAIFKDSTNSIVVVYGDVNSTLGASLAAKLHNLTLVHVEAGLRSGEDLLPEEINRKIIDSISDVYCTTLPSAINNLLREGISAERIHFCGNTMIDSLMTVDSNAEPLLEGQEEYVLLTLHRGANVDNPTILHNIIREVEELAKEIKVIFPVHPRTSIHLGECKDVFLVPPMSYINFVSSMKYAKFVITDSGGIQEETTYLGVPCFTLRPATERPETVTWGTNVLIAPEDIINLLDRPQKNNVRDIPLWDGLSGMRVANVILTQLSKQRRI